MGQAHKGFTLVELMIALAIVAILASLAVPAYMEYMVRGRVVELIAMGGDARARVSENIASQGGAIGVAACDGVNAITIATDNTASLTCTLGALTITGTDRVRNVVLTYTPSAVTAGVVDWRCSTTVASQRFVPSECR